MALLQTSPPAAEPVTLAEAKAHLRLEGEAEDGLIAGLITAARLHVERGLARALITQGWSLFLDAWPAAAWLRLPLAPVQSVTSVVTYGADDAATTFDPANYWLDAASHPARLVLRGVQPWPTPGRRANGIEIAFVAGFGDQANDVPAPIRQAILMLVAHWFENRQPVALEGAPAEVPATVHALLSVYRSVRL